MCNMLKAVSFFIVVHGVMAYLSANRDSIQINPYTLQWSTNNIEKWWFYGEVRGVSAEKPFKIILVDWHGKDVVCRSHYYQYDFTKNIIVYKKDRNTIININRVTDEMSTTWKCTLKYTDTFSTGDIYFDFNVREAKPPQMILVNSVIIPTQKHYQQSHEIKLHTATYYYKDGDGVVDVTCINPDYAKCTVVLNYDYVDALTGTKETIKSNVHVGFRTEFKAIHNDTTMTCSFTCPRRRQIDIVLVKFLLKDDLGEAVLLKIKGRTVRGMRAVNEDNTNVNIYIKYALMLTKIAEISFEFNIIADDIEFKPFCTGCRKDDSNKYQIMRYYNPHTHMNVSKVKYTAEFKKIPNRTEHLEVGFTFLNPKFKARTRVNINLTSDNTLLELYEYNKITKFYYRYEDGDVLTLSCRLPLWQGRSLYFDGPGSQIQRNKIRILEKTVTMDLKHSNNNTTIQCEERGGASVLALVRVLFLLKVRNTTSLAITTNLNTTLPTTTPISSTNCTTYTTTTILKTTLTSTTLKPTTRTISTTSITTPATTSSTTTTVKSKIITTTPLTTTPSTTTPSTTTPSATTASTTTSSTTSPSTIAPSTTSPSTTTPSTTTPSTTTPSTTTPSTTTPSTTTPSTTTPSTTTPLTTTSSITTPSTTTPSTTTTSTTLITSPSITSTTLSTTSPATTKSTTTKTSTTTSKSDFGSLAKDKSLDEISNNPKKNGSNNKVIIMVVVFLVIIVMACISTVLYNRKKRNRFIEDEPTVYYKRSSGATDPAVYDYAIPDVQKRRILDDNSENDIYAKPMPKSLRQSKTNENIYGNQHIPNFDNIKVANSNQALHNDIYSEVLPKRNRPYNDQSNTDIQNIEEEVDYADLQNNQERDNSTPTYGNGAMPNNIYGKVLPKQNRQNENLLILYLKEGDTKLQNIQKHDSPQASYSNQRLYNDIYSEAVPKSRRSQICPNSRGHVVNNADFIDFEPTYSEPN